MLKLLHVTNYRAIADLRLELQPKQLLLGLNGAGKTSIFDVLAAVRDLLVEGEKCEEVFPLTTIPRWLQTSRPQTFSQRVEIAADGEHGEIHYDLVIEQDEKLARSRVLSEELRSDGKPLFSFRKGKVQLYHDSHTKGPAYTFDWNRSAMASVLSVGSGNQRLTWFKERMRDVHCVRIDAPRMSARSERESPYPERDLSNFAAWYRRALVANASAGSNFLAAVRQVIGGIESLDLRELGQGVMVLQAAFKRRHGASGEAPGKVSKTFSLDFNELSDGQRTLIGLYALLHFVLRENTTLCIDEPDNFIALAEIQPWLSCLEDRVDDLGAQVLIASHHPEMLNMLARDHGLVIERDGCGPTRARHYSQDSESDLPPAERIARGWEGE